MSERQEKREQFTKTRSKSSKLLPLVMVALVVAGGAAWLFVSPGDGGHRLVSADRDGRILLATGDFADGQARFYRFEDESGPIDFFVVQSRDGVIRAAFDSCDVCYRELKGYRQEGNEMVCVNCGQRFPTDKINVLKGGCNPAPLERQQRADQVVIAASDIKRGAGYFAGRVN
ncbi:MAG: DUF2318 domain-containing protein [Desulfuromonas sp.]|nr:MAG: DUF2318 domain-containing protein [Desulfuromonas sp.]